MAVKTSELVAFFETLATNHKLLNHSIDSKHFYRMELNEFATGATTFNGYNLLLEVMPVKYSGNLRDNCFKIREVSFIVIKSIKPINKEQISLAFDETETIMEDFLSKINNSLCGADNSRLNFDIETVEGSQVTDGKNYGMRCLVDIKSSHNFEVKPDNWVAL